MIGRTGKLAAGSFILAVLLWYAGAGDAQAKMIDAGPLVAIPVFALGYALVAWQTRPRREKSGLALVAIGAALGAFVGWTLVAGLNVWLDRSAAEPRDADVVDMRTSSRSPPVAVVLFEGRRVDFPAEIAHGCKEGRHAVLSVRRGGLGARWVEKARCPDVKSR
jgi:hypothetical protein